MNDLNLKSYITLKDRTVGFSAVIDDYWKISYHWTGHTIKENKNNEFSFHIYDKLTIECEKFTKSIAQFSLISCTKSLGHYQITGTLHFNRLQF